MSNDSNTGQHRLIQYHAPVMKHMPTTPSLQSLNMVDTRAPGLRQPPYVIVRGIIFVRVHEHANAPVTTTANVAQNSLTILN